MGHQNSYTCLVYVSCLGQYKLLEMHYTNHIGSFSIHSSPVDKGRRFNVVCLQGVYDPKNL